MSTDKQSRLEQFKQAITAASDKYDSDIYFYSGGIDDEGYGTLTSEVADNDGTRSNALLILTTNGGLANSAYQIARLLQNSYETFTLWCPSRCKSAGTLVALGASKLIMDHFSELGPLDVQLVKQNEIFARKSGLLAKSSFDAMADASFELYERLMIAISLESRGNVTFKLASELSATMASTMMSPIYAQINPEIVGSENRDLDIAFQYGSRLAEIGGNASHEQVYRLVHDYPSHDFVIDAREAEGLFNVIEVPTAELYQVIGFIGDAAYAEASSTIVRCLTRFAAKEEPEDEDTDAEQPKAGEEIGEPGMDGGGPADRPGDPPSSGQSSRADPSNDDDAGTTERDPQAAE